MTKDSHELGTQRPGAERLAALRQELLRLNLHGFLVPRADEYQNEYVPPCAERLLWLTGFSGSAGIAAALLDKAAIFVDGRYVLQAQNQIDAGLFSILKLPEQHLSQWLEENVPPSARVGYDPRLHNSKEIKSLTASAKKKGYGLVPLDENPIDKLWLDRPAAPAAPVRLHPLRYAGRTAEAKILEIQETLGKAGEDAALITAQDSIAWLFNIRGSDVSHTPLALSRAIVYAHGQPELFIDGRKLPPEVRAALSAIVSIHEPDALLSRLNALGRAPEKGDGSFRVRVDSASSPQLFAAKLSEAGVSISEGQDPCLLPKAKKNQTEIEGARAAHRRDGAALCRFLAWLDANAPSGLLDELSAAAKLESMRRDTGRLLDLSFDTISGAGPNGAIVHYRASPETNRTLEPGSLYLIDSGGQYPDGTTDVTRTVAIGSPTAEMRRHFTLVLKGHIAIATARFPKGVSGRNLDSLARRALWSAGLDYDHGTGHGVGSCLSVHEGPQSIARRGSDAALEPGMILSDEPGYYREGRYGVRIENLLLVTPPESIPGGEIEMLGFETLTLAPIDRRLIDAALLSSDELQWLNAYHARIRTELGPLLSDAERSWLNDAVAPIAGQLS
jgi:Xaa-Pro aminopeptidase